MGCWRRTLRCNMWSILWFTWALCDALRMEKIPDPRLQYYFLVTGKAGYTLWTHIYDEVREWCEKHTQCRKQIRGEMRDGFPTGDVNCILSVRHPFEMIVSAYNYWKSDTKAMIHPLDRHSTLLEKVTT